LEKKNILVSCGENTADLFGRMMRAISCNAKLFLCSFVCRRTVLQVRGSLCGSVTRGSYSESQVLVEELSMSQHNDSLLMLMMFCSLFLNRL